MDQHFSDLVRQGGHNCDETGAQGEANFPVWFNARRRLAEFTENQTNCGRANNQRDAMREVQGALGVIQLPLGPGNPPMRSEVAAQNPPQQNGPLEIGAGIEIREIREDQQEDKLTIYWFRPGCRPALPVLMEHPNGTHCL